MSGARQWRERPDSNPGGLTSERSYSMAMFNLRALIRNPTSRHAAPVSTYGTLDPSDKGEMLAWLLSKLPCHL